MNKPNPTAFDLVIATFLSCRCYCPLPSESKTLIQLTTIIRQTRVSRIDRQKGPCTKATRILLEIKTKRLTVMLMSNFLSPSRTKSGKPLFHGLVRRQVKRKTVRGRRLTIALACIETIQHNTHPRNLPSPDYKFIIVKVAQKLTFEYETGNMLSRYILCAQRRRNRLRWRDVT